MADTPPHGDVRPSRTRRLLLTVLGLTLAFLVGFTWQWWAARGYQAERDALSRSLTLERLSTTLAAAVIQTDRGAFDGARDLASSFFTGLQENESLADTPEAATTFRDILSRRDGVITSLSRSDPASEDVLTQMFVRFRVATGAPEVAIPIPVPGPRPAPADSPAASAPTGG